MRRGLFTECNLILYFSVVFPFLIPVLAKMGVSFFPTDAVDFFMRSLAKIKQEREKEAHKVSGNLRAIVAESTLK